VWFMMDCLFAYMASEYLGWRVPFDAEEQSGLPAHQRPPNECSLPFPSPLLPCPLLPCPLLSSPLLSSPLLLSHLLLSVSSVSLCFNLFLYFSK